VFTLLLHNDWIARQDQSSCALGMPMTRGTVVLAGDGIRATSGNG
jgi:hypothetical protein